MNIMTRHVQEVIDEKVQEGYIPYAMSWDGLDALATTAPFGYSLAPIAVKQTRHASFFAAYLAHGVS
jgi:hypothetical protein